MIIYFDTETTGLYPGRIIQLSYIIEDCGSITGKNFFFGVDYIDPSATAVHGFTVEKLAQLCCGHSFSTDAEEIYDDFSRADLVVAHNFSFDLSFMLAEFGYMDRQFRYNESFDSMKYFKNVTKLPSRRAGVYKYPKLSELCDFYEIYPYDVNRMVGEVFEKSTLAGHDARFDSVAMYLAVKAGRNTLFDLEETFNKYI